MMFVVVSVVIAIVFLDKPLLAVDVSSLKSPLLFHPCTPVRPLESFSFAPHWLFFIGRHPMNEQKGVLAVKFTENNKRHQHQQPHGLQLLISDLRFKPHIVLFIPPSMIVVQKKFSKRPV